MQGSDEEIAERLLVNTGDVSALKSYYRDAVTVSGADDEEKVVVLFRFATSDYYSAAVDIMELRTILPDKHTEGQAYRAWESVFFDFESYSSLSIRTACTRSFPWCPVPSTSSMR